MVTGPMITSFFSKTMKFDAKTSNTSNTARISYYGSRMIIYADLARGAVALLRAKVAVSLTFDHDT